MGKASQSKKVARAARAAPQARPSRRRWIWPGVIALILVVGLGIIVVSRRDSHPAPAQTITNETSTTTTPPPTVSTPAPPGGSTGSTAATGSSTVTTAAGSSSSTVAPSTTAVPSP